MARYIGFDEEAAFAEAWTAPVKFINVESEDIRPNQNPIYIQGTRARDVHMHVGGRFDLGGSIAFPVDPLDIPLLLKAVLGESTPNIEGTTTAYRHEIRAADTVPSLKAEICDDSIQWRKLIGIGVNRLTIEAAMNDIVKGTADLICNKEEIVTTTTGTSPAYGDQPPFVFHQAGTTEIEAGAITTLEAFRLTIENNLVPDVTRLGSRFLKGLYPQNRTVSGTADFSFDDSTQYQRVLGTTDALTPTVPLEAYQMQVAFESTVDAGVGFPYKMDINIPKVIFAATGVPLRTRDRIVQPVEWRAVLGPTGTDIIEIDIWNDETDIPE